MLRLNLSFLPVLATVVLPLAARHIHTQIMEGIRVIFMCEATENMLHAARNANLLLANVDDENAVLVLGLDLLWVGIFRQPAQDVKLFASSTTLQCNKLLHAHFCILACIWLHDISEVQTASGTTGSCDARHGHLEGRHANDVTVSCSEPRPQETKVLQDSTLQRKGTREQCIARKWA